MSTSRQLAKKSNVLMQSKLIQSSALNKLNKSDTIRKALKKRGIKKPLNTGINKLTTN